MAPIYASAGEEASPMQSLALVVLAVLVVAGLVLVDRLSSVSALQDCLMTRATNCASVSPPPSVAPAGRNVAPSTTR